MLITLAIWEITEWIPAILNNIQLIYDIIKGFQF